ncbi:uncharacterized protein LOC143016102 [Genypterus blacodes]|uniref:uncharacterized protein LOC143016102 n=1 Tax=Genypterus blacodes TaxID=154954 RepID=UPI003F7603E6
MRKAAVLTLLSLLSLGHTAPVNNCDVLTKPIHISKQEILGKWIYISGSSNIPGSRSLAYLMNSVLVEITATAQDNILNIYQSQRIVGQCSTWNYNVTFENSTLTVEEPFPLKEVYLPTDCPDCLVIVEDIVLGEDKFTSLLLFSKSRSVSPAVVETFKRQAECLQMASPLMSDPNNEICPHSTSQAQGLSAMKAMLEGKLQKGVGQLLDNFFDMFIN